MNKYLKIVMSVLILAFIAKGFYSGYMSMKAGARPENLKENGVPLNSERQIQYETINGIEVPPEPDPEINNATLTGVDVNGNGVRDDVERVIAQTFGNNAQKYTEALAFFKAEGMTVVLQTTESVQIYGKAVDCTTMSADELDPITFIHLNTNERGRAYAMANAGASGGQRDDCEGWESEILN